MKDRIYTIPVNEAFDKHSECPLCTLAKKLEDEAVEYAIGAAMMEPDIGCCPMKKVIATRTLD